MGQIWGKVMLGVSDRGFAIFADSRIVLFHDVILWSSSGSEPRPMEPRTFYVTFPLPTYSRGRGTPLPPTMSQSFPSLEVQVRYGVKIDMVRKGLRRHECTGTTIYYLPRSIPTSLHSAPTAFEDVEDKTEAEEGIQWKFSDASYVSQDKTGTHSLVQVTFTNVTAVVY